MKLALTKKQEIAVNLLKTLQPLIGDELVEAILNNPEETEEQRSEKFAHLDELKNILAPLKMPMRKN